MPDAERASPAIVLGILDNSDLEAKSADIQRRKEKAERELREARARSRHHKTLSPHGLHRAGSPDGSASSVSIGCSDIEEADALARRSGGHAVQHTLHGESESDDGLSYTDTESSAHHEPAGKTAVGDSLYTSLSYRSPVDSGVYADGTRSGIAGASAAAIISELREAKRQLEQEKSERRNKENRFAMVESESRELFKKLEHMSKNVELLEDCKLELESRMRSLEFNLSDEAERRKSTDALLKKAKDQLARKEDLYTAECTERQKAEMTLRTCQVDLRSIQQQIKQLEDERMEFQGALEKERRMRTDLDNKNRELTSKLAARASVSKLEEAGEDSRRTAADLSGEISALKNDHDRMKLQHQDDLELQLQKIDELQELAERHKNDAKLNEDALMQASVQYNVQVSLLQKDLMSSRAELEREHAERDTLDSEVRTLQARLTNAASELDRSSETRKHLEKQLQQEKNTWERNGDRKDAEVTSLKATNQELLERIRSAEERLRRAESELQLQASAVMERVGELGRLQKEAEDKKHRLESTEKEASADKERATRAQTKLELLQERLQSLQHELLSARQENGKQQQSHDGGDLAGGGMALNNLIQTLKSESEWMKQALEDKNSHMSESIGRMKDELAKSENKVVRLEQEVRLLQTQLNEADRKLANADANHKVTTQMKDSIEKENASLKAKIDSLHIQLDSSRLSTQTLEPRHHETMGRLQKTEQELATARQQLDACRHELEAMSVAKAHVLDQLRATEGERAKIESNLTLEAHRSSGLEKELQESQKIRKEMDGLLNNLKASRNHLEDKLGEEVLGRTVYEQEAEEVKGLLNLEAKARMRVSQKLLQLEKFRADAEFLLSEEKRNARKAVEKKTQAEIELQKEIDKRARLQKQVLTLKAHLKSAKARINELSTYEAHLKSLHGDLDLEKRVSEDLNSTIQRKLQDETFERDRLELRCEELQGQLSRLHAVEKVKAKLEKAKERLEDEYEGYKRHVAVNYVERAELDKLRHDAEVAARIELNDKLEQVNGYLSEQAHAREKLDAMRDTTESRLKDTYETSRRELLDELNNLKIECKDLVVKAETNEAEAHRYKELYESEAKLRSRALANHSSPTRGDFDWLGSEREQKNELLKNGGPTLLRSRPGWRSASPSRSEKFPGDLDAKVKRELDNSIARHLESIGGDLHSPRMTYDDLVMSPPSAHRSQSQSYTDVLRRNYLLQ